MRRLLRAAKERPRSTTVVVADDSRAAVVVGVVTPQPAFAGTPDTALSEVTFLPR